MSSPTYGFAPDKLVLAALLPLISLGAGCSRAPVATTTLTAAEVATSAPVLDTASLVEKVKASVVNITVESSTKAARAGAASPFDFFFRNGPGGPGPDLPRKQSALGSGFLFDDQGHVLTNAHVVDGAEVVKVKLADERELVAKVRGRDERLDVAVLEIEGAKGLPFASFGASARSRVGEPVVAIGNPFGLGHTVTTGIVSAKGRAIGAGPYDDFLQTDASINPGNSGGPLFDGRGQVIGMNTAINPAGQGIGFAIPSDEIKLILPQLVADGHVKRGRLGVHVQEIDDALAAGLGLGEQRGALVGDVEKDGPAARAGLANGDVVVRVGETPIKHARDLSRTIARHAPGSKVELTVRRGSETKVVHATLAALDQPASQASAGARPGATEPSGLGLAVGDADGGGAVVRQVAPDGPSAGVLRPGDVIVEADRKPVASASDLHARARESSAKRPLVLRVQRGDATLYVAIDRATK
ncbi:MAG: trypsin-like peptidase domain-containing protein [Labilithrix sp.]|nr:trypsin-like peptidase domain-containing protein [Labilithrix sp.]